MADGHGLDFSCRGCDAGKVSALQHQLGPALPAIDLAVLAVARVQPEGARTHVHLPVLRIALGLRQSSIQRLLELCLRGSRVCALFARGQRQHQQILLHLNRSRG